MKRWRWLKLCSILFALVGFGCGKLLGFGDDRLASGGTGGEGPGGESTTATGATTSDTAGTGGAGAAGGGEQGGRGGDVAARGGTSSSGGGASAEGGRAGSESTAGQGPLSGTGNGAGEGGGPAEAPCAGQAGPEMIRVGSYCIDRTEVTRKQYGYFVLAGVDPKTVANCEWKTSFSSPDAVAEELNFPVGDVDWCDAKAYCEWAGKRLCGKIGGGALPDKTNYTVDPDLDEWYRVCSRAGSLKYVYGASYDANICNSAADLMSEVGAYRGCTTPEGIVDLLGNVWEWENACNEDAGSTADKAVCAHRGGSSFFRDISCTDRMDQLRTFTAHDLGFRCCSD